MQKSIYLDDRSTIAALVLRFGRRDSTFVWTRAHLGSSLIKPRDARVPDLMVAFNCDVARVWEDNGYCVASQPHAPQFVLEIAPRGGGIVDCAEKRADYERYGVAEYWRFDPAAGDYLALAGDRLIKGRYQPISIDWFDAQRGRAYSRALGLYVCWEREQLLFFHPDEGRHLRSYSEEAAELRALVAARRRDEAQAEALRRAETDARRLAEALADAEARAAEAKARASAAEARLAELTRRHENGGA